MSLLRTTQSTDSGVMRLTSYHRTRREHNGHVDRAIGLLDLSSRSSQHAVSEMTPQSLYTTSTDEELHSIIGKSTLMDRSSSAGGESRDPTEESTPGMSRTSSSSSFSLSKAFASPQQQRYVTPPQQYRFSTPPTPRRPTPPGLRSPSKSFDHGHKISLNNPRSLQSMSVGKVEVQNAPVSPTGSLSPRTPGTKRRQRPGLGTFGSMERVDAQGQPMPVGQKSEAYERASKLLKKVDASKQAAEKVERARQAARQAMEKARRAKAAKEKATGGSKLIRFSDEDMIHSVEEISIARNSRSNTDYLNGNDFQPLQDDDDESTVKDRYLVDDRNRYEVENAEEDALDDVLDSAASQMRYQSRVLRDGEFPPLSPPRQSGKRDELNDMMDFAEAMLSGKSLAVQNDNQVGKVNDIVNDACSFTDEFICVSDNDVAEAKAAAIKATSPRRYPMPQNPAVLERVLEEKGFLATPPPSPPPEVMDSVTYRVKQRNESNRWTIHDETALEDDASHGDELDDIMNFAAGLLGSKSAGQSTSQQDKKERNKKKSPTKKQQKQASMSDNLGQGDELDDIMDFAAGLLGSKQPDAMRVPARVQTTPSIVEPIQSSPTIPKKESSKPKQVENSSCFADACSVWTEEFFRAPEEKVVFDATGNRVTKESEIERPSLLQTATKDKVPVPPPPEAFQLKPVPTLADDLTDKSSPSFNVPDSPDAIELTDTDERVKQRSARKSSPIPVTTVDDDSDRESGNLSEETRRKESQSTQLVAVASDKQSKPGTMLDSNDEYWDTLSTIASNSKEFSMNRISHLHRHAHDKAKPIALEALHEGAPFGSILCGWLGMEKQNGGLKRPHLSKTGDTFGDTYGNTFVSTEGSIIPEIPKMIEYPSQPMDEHEEMQNKVLNTVETLITKRSSDSSDSTESFYLQSGLNSFQADDPEQAIDRAVERGQKMAKPASPTTSRYGNDKGDEPLGSPAHLSHDSNSTPKSKKVTDRRKPWDRDRSPPKARFQPIDNDLNTRLETEDSELAAMLGIKKIVSQDKEEVKEAYGFVSGSNSQDSSLSDLLMVLTRSAGDDDMKENPCMVKSDQDAVLTPASSEVDVILSSLRRAETMGHVDNESVDLVASPQSPKRKGIKPEDRLLVDTEKQLESVQQQREQAAPVPLPPNATKEKSGDSQPVLSEQQREKSEAVSPTEKAEKDTFEQLVQKNASCSMVGLLFDKDIRLAQSGTQQLEKAQQQREQALATKTWAEQNAAANEAAAKEVAKKKQVSSQMQQQSDGVHFDEDNGLPNSSLQHLDKEDRQREEEIKPRASSTKPPTKQQSQLIAKETSCPPMFAVLVSDGESITSGHAQQVSPAKSRPQEYVSTSQSDDDEPQVIRSPTDFAVRMSPVKNLKVTQDDVQQLEEVSSVSLEQSAQSKTKIMTELLLKYDSIIDQLIHNTSDGTGQAIPKNSPDVEAALKELREKREQALAVSKRTAEKQESHDSTLPRRATSPRRNVEATSRTTSPRQNGEATSPDRNQQSLKRSPSRANSSPTQSPSRSSRLSSMQQRHQLRPLISKSVSPRRPTKASDSLQNVSPSRSKQSRLNSSGSRSLYGTTLSPTPSPRRQTTTVQARDVSPAKRSYVNQERIAAARSPRRSSSSRRSAPRPEDKIEELRRRRAESLSPPKRRRNPYKSQPYAEFKVPRDTPRSVRRAYSVEHPRHHSFFNDGDDQSEYGAMSREIREELNLARRASESIRHSHDELFEELGVFQNKLLRHSRRKNCEREFISESRNAMNDFQHRLEQVRQNAHATANSGRETPDTLDQVELALEEAWGDFGVVRGTMLSNLRILNEAKEELMRERLYREEENDDDQLQMLENMIQDIRRTQQNKAENVIDSIRDKRRYGMRAGQLHYSGSQDRGSYLPRDRSTISSRQPSMTRRSTSAPRQTFTHRFSRSPNHSSSRYAAYR